MSEAFFPDVVQNRTGSRPNPGDLTRFRTSSRARLLVGQKLSKNKSDLYQLFEK
jgi:hypothetical protein